VPPSSAFRAYFQRAALGWVSGHSEPVRAFYAPYVGVWGTEGKRSTRPGRHVQGRRGRGRSAAEELPDAHAESGASAEAQSWPYTVTGCN
jgi:hypothetical protein